MPDQNDIHGTLQITWKQPPADDGERYAVTFKGYDRDHPGTRLRTFATCEGLERFLQIDAYVSTVAIDHVLSELRSVGTAEILDVVLPAADLVRLGLE